MKSTGIERKLDELGRVVIPKEIRKVLNIPTGAPLSIYLDGNKIIFEKSAGACSICGNTVDVKDVDGKTVCTECIIKIKKM